MTRDKYDELQFALLYGSRTVSNAEIIEAIGFLDNERMALQYKVLGHPCGSSVIGRPVGGLEKMEPIP